MDIFRKLGARYRVFFLFQLFTPKLIIVFLVQDLFEMAVSRYLGQPEKKDLLLHLLQWMPGQGYVVDSSTRNLILKNSHLFGRQLIAEVLSKQQVNSRAQKSR